MGFWSRHRDESTSRRQRNIRSAGRRSAGAAPASATQAASQAAPGARQPDVRVGVTGGPRGAATPRPFNSPNNPGLSDGIRITAGGHSLNGQSNVPVTPRNPTPTGEGASITVRQTPLPNMQVDAHGAVPVAQRSSQIQGPTSSAAQAVASPQPVTPRAQARQAVSGSVVSPAGAPNTPAAPPAPADDTVYLKPPTNAGDGSYAVAASGTPKPRAPEPKVADGVSAQAPPSSSLGDEGDSVSA